MAQRLAQVAGADDSAMYEKQPDWQTVTARLFLMESAEQVAQARHQDRLHAVEIAIPAAFKFGASKFSQPRRPKFSAVDALRSRAGLSELFPPLSTALRRLGIGSERS